MKRILLSISGNQICYHVLGVLTFAPLYTTKEQWLEWGESLP